jgi:hypothetical protein
MSAWGKIKKYGGYAVAPGLMLGKKLAGAMDPKQSEFRDPLAEQAGMAGQFAGVGEQGFAQRGDQMQGVADHLGRQMRGEESLSAEQLRQGLQQLQAQQQSMAAGARPGQQGMAARTAAMQSGQLGAGLAGQQALAGIQERAAAAQGLGGLLGGMRGQDLQAALGGRGQAIVGYGALVGADHQLAGQPQGWERMLGGAAGVGSMAALMSDETLKEDIRDADGDVEALLDGLKAYGYKYKEGGAAKHMGADRTKGEQVGIMAQDLARTEAGKGAVYEAEDGKLGIDVPKLSGMLAAAASNLHKRVRKLEG